MPLPVPPRARRRAFTLIELLVVILVLGVLAVLAVVGYATVTAKARTTAAVTSLRQAALAVEVDLANDPDATQLVRGDVLASLKTSLSATFQDGFTAAAYRLGEFDDSPTGPGDFVVGFDAGDGFASNDPGIRATLMTATTDGHVFAQILGVGELIGSVYEVEAPAAGAKPATPADVLADSSPIPVVWVAPTALVVTAADGAGSATWSPAAFATAYTVTASVLSTGSAAGSWTTSATGVTLTGLSNGTVYLVTVTGHYPNGATQAGSPVTVTPASATESYSAWAPAGAASDAFGSAVAVDGDVAVVGAPGDDTAGSNSGAVYIYARTGTTWTLQAKRTPYYLTTADQFGAAVAVSGNTILVGAPGSDLGALNAGAAFVLTRTAGVWSAEATLSPISGAPGSEFGTSVALAGNRAVGGAPGTDVSGKVDVGSATSFTRSGTSWTQGASPHPGSSNAYARFGAAVAIDDANTAVGSPGAPFLGADSGSVYIFPGSTSFQSSNITEPSGITGNQFGTALALSAGTLLVGSPGADARGADSGAAWAFQSGQWNTGTKLAPTALAAGDRFGTSVANSSGRAVVGAPNTDASAAADSGAAYAYTLSGTTWSAPLKLVAQGASAYDHFGQAVALAGSTAITGSADDDTPAGINAGSAHVFPLAAP